MKRKFWTIQNGEVIAVSPFARGLSSPEVEAKTKSEASKILLGMLTQYASDSPQLRVKNGAFLMVFPNGKDYSAWSGTIDRANNPLCLASYPTPHQAFDDKSFAYYSSEEYLKARG